ncbi:MAG: hypothetical protein NTW50_04025 [Candidatus Berkelbacteria bacterium]|nr:hypothetical protein [Candidatus Berkelbacteria bacterium]
MTGKINFEYSFGLKVDQSIAKTGSHWGHLVFSQNGKAVKMISIQVIVANPLNISIDEYGANYLNFGIDVPSKSGWESEGKTITLQNLSTDRTLTLNSGTNFVNGINFTMSKSGSTENETSYTLAPKSTLQLTARVSVPINNNVINNKWEAWLTFSTSNVTTDFGLRFYKFYAMDLNIKQSGTMIGLTDTNLNEVYYQGGAIGHNYYYFNNPSLYDVGILSGDYPTPDQDYFNSYWSVLEKADTSNDVYRRDIDVSTQAKNLVTINLSDEKGGSDNKQEDCVYELVNKSTGAKIMWYELWRMEQIPTDMSKIYTNDISDRFKIVQMCTNDRYDASKINLYYNEKDGPLNSNVTFGNKPEDFKKLVFRSDNLPLIAGHHYNSHIVFPGSMTNDQATRNFPSDQTVYSLVPARLDFGLIYQHVYEVTPDCLPYGFAMTTCNYMYTSGYTDPGSQTVMRQAILKPAYNYNLQRWIYPDYVTPMKDQSVENNTINSSLAPYVWLSRFDNGTNDTTVRIADSPVSLYPFADQDYGLTKYPDLPYQLLKNGSVVKSDVLQGATTAMFPSYAWKQDDLMNYTGNNDSFELKTDAFKYQINGFDYSSVVDAKFDTRKSDKNPPAINWLHFYADGKRSQSFINSQKIDNTVQFSLDPVGGNLTDVKLAWATDLNGSYTPVVVTKKDTDYVATLRQLNLTNKIACQIVATDDSNNQLTYSFELPASGDFVATKPAVEAGADQKSFVQKAVSLAPTISNATSYSWSKDSGSGNLKFSNQQGTGANAATTVSSDAAGVYVLKLTAKDDANNTVSDSLTFTVNKAADINGDNTVDEKDFVLLLFNWGKLTNPMTDLNTDGKVDNSDFVLLMYWWGK